MQTARLFRVSVTAIVLNLAVTISGISQGYVSFDSTDSDVGAGVYCFLLSGVSLGMAGSPYDLDNFTLSGFSAAGNTQTVGAISGPSAFPLVASDMDMIQYQASPLFSDSPDLNGLLKVSATPNLAGSIAWSFSFFIVPGSPVPPTISGDVSISSVPEPSSITLISIAVMLFVVRRLYMTMWPNTALEPTPVTPVSLRCGFRVGGSRWRRGSALDR